VKRQKEWLAANPLQACRVCGRYFTARRKEPICSMGCKEKAEADDKKSSWRGD
jgi:hypothetical protein